MSPSDNVDNYVSVMIFSGKNKKQSNCDYCRRVTLTGVASHQLVAFMFLFVFVDSHLSFLNCSWVHRVFRVRPTVNCNINHQKVNQMVTIAFSMVFLTYANI